MTLFERADTGRRVTWASILGLILVPIIIAAGFVLATWQAGDRLDHVKAAVVNNDEGTKIDGKPVPLGRQLAAGLVDRDGQNLDWVLSDDEDAESGLRSGAYAAVITIPEGFSEAVTSATQEKDPMRARQATVDVRTSTVSPVADATLGQAIAEAARTSFNSEFAKQYLDGIYVGFNTIGEQFRDVADAAGELDKGAGQLADGTGEAADGAGKLSDGLGLLSAGGGKLRDGANGLAGGARQLSDGAGGLADGAGKLSDGLGKMDEKTKELPDQTRKLADGAGQLSDGVDAYTGGVDEMVIGLRDFADSIGDGGDADLTGDLERLGKGSHDLSTGLSGLNKGLDSYQSGLRGQADELEKLKAKGADLRLADLVRAGLMKEAEAKQLRQALCAGPDGSVDPDSPQCAAAEAAYATGVLSASITALDGAADGLDEKDEQGRSLSGALDGLADGASKLDDGIQQLVTGLGEELPKLLDGLKGMGDQADQLLDASGKLRDGAGQLADGTDQLADGMGPLADGISASADGAGKLSEGAGKLSDGAGKLADGADEYAAGVGTYTSGVDQSAAGASALALGLGQLGDGAEKLADGTGRLADGLDKGKDEIPSYTAPERDKLAETVTAPVAEGADPFSDIPQAASIALLLMLALWVGALVTYMVVRAVSASALTSRRSSWSVMAKGLIPGVIIALIQAVVLAILANVVLDLHLLRFTSVLGISLFAGAVFMVLNYALVAWFGGIGRFVSVVLLVLAVAGRTIGAVPQFFDQITPFLPMTPALDGIIAAATGMPGLGHAWGALFGWLIVGLAAGFAAVVRQRTLGPGQLSRLAHI